MKQHLVLWGDIGTDRKALIAIYLQEEKNKVHIYAFPREGVTKELQEQLFAWSAGGEFAFPEDALHWEISASVDNILPDGVRVDKPELVTRAQAEWGRMIMSARLFMVLNEEGGLLVQKSESLTDYSQEMWDNARELWGKIGEYRKKNELSWEQADLLKNNINMVFDALKAVRRIDHEKEDDSSKHNFNVLEKKINDAVARLIYPEEWPKLFDVFKAIQEEVKKFQLRTGHRRKLFDLLNEAFDDLRKYRKAEYVNRNKSRIASLESAMRGISQSVEREKENYKEQFEKMMHYTRGKLSEEEVSSRLTHITDRIKEKEEKVTNIVKTIASIHKQMEKDERRDTDRIKKKEDERKKKEEQQAAAKEVKKAEAEEVATPVTETPSEPEVETNTAEEAVPVSEAEEPVIQEEIPESETPAEVPAEEVAVEPEAAPVVADEVVPESEEISVSETPAEEPVEALPAEPEEMPVSETPAEEPAAEMPDEVEEAPAEAEEVEPEPEENISEVPAEPTAVTEDIPEEEEESPEKPPA